MNIITRFAPSPTGYLHIGNVRTALICYLFAKSQGGKFMLRLDDTDIERSKEEYSAQIQEDLKWLGLNWDVFSRQSDRMDRYNEIKQQLVDAGRLYPCYETAEEIEIKRKMLLGRGLPPIYDRAALNLSDSDKKKFEEQGRAPHWRFKMDESAVIEWDDKIKGHMRFEAKNLSDPVLIRENGCPTYMLPSAIDDMDFKISHIFRGEDHVTNTAVQIQLFEAMGSHIPQFAHHSLMKGKNGKISKREGGFDIKSLREVGIEPIAIKSLMARLGTSLPVEAFTDMEKLTKGFDVTAFSKAAAVYDPIELERLNAKIIHQMDYKQVKERSVTDGIDEEFWNSIRNNLKTIAEVKEWKEICRDKLSPVIDDAEFTNQASELLPEGKWDENTWNEWINKVKDVTGKKGKDLFMPIRKALTARDNGPELKYILPLIGREKALARLLGRAA